MPAKMQHKKRSSRPSKRQVKALTGLTDIRIGLPDRFKVTMPYGTYQILTPAAGTVTTYSFRGNSVYDPDFTGAGSTASMYTQLSALYNRYRVISSRISVQFVNTGTVPSQNFVVAGIANSPGNVLSQLTARHVAKGTCSPGGPITWTCNASATTAKIFGVPTAQVFSEDDFAGLVGSNPNNVWYWHISCYDPAAVAGALNVEIRIDYEVVWSMPLTLAP